MAQRYIKIFYDWLDVTAAFTTEEKGQLIDAMVSYAAGKPYEVTGKVAIIFPAFKAQIDRDNESYQKQVAGGKYGKLGGRPKNPRGYTNNPNNPRGYEKTPRVTPKPLAPQDKDKDKDNDNEYDDDNDNIAASSPPSYDDNPFSEQHGPTPSFDTISVYASNNLRAVSDGNLSDIIDYANEMGEELVRYAIDRACAQGAPYWSYTEKILIQYKDHGIKTLADAKAADEKFRHSKNEPNNNDDERGNDNWVW